MVRITPAKIKWKIWWRSSSFQNTQVDKCAPLPAKLRKLNQINKKNELLQIREMIDHRKKHSLFEPNPKKKQQRVSPNRAPLPNDLSACSKILIHKNNARFFPNIFPCKGTVVSITIANIWSTITQVSSQKNFLYSNNLEPKVPLQWWSPLS